MMHRVTLSFIDRNTEASYLDASAERDRLQGRTALIVGTIVYLLYGVLDTWFVPDRFHETVWIIRLCALSVPAVVFVLSFTSFFVTHRHLLLASVGFAAGIGLMTILAQLTVASATYIFPGLILVTFYTYNFVGTRFFYALCVDVSLILTYNTLFGAIHGYTLPTLASHDFFIVSANLIGGIAGYMNEHQRRLLFIRERELNEERNHHLTRALHDPLTGLPNRMLLLDRMEILMASGERNNAKHCGFFIDLDGFKDVNDRFGHEAGDTVLQIIAQRLRETVRESDTVARLGGDEFFMIVNGIGTDTDARLLARKLIDVIEQPIPDLPADAHLSASIGMCYFPYPGMTVSDAIRRADQAMYHAKISGKSTFIIAKSVDNNLSGLAEAQETA